VKPPKPAPGPLRMTAKEYTELGGCMHKLRTWHRTPATIGLARPYDVKYRPVDLRCKGVGKNHLVTNIDGKIVRVHEAPGGERWT
jgi:hypothetical protein